MSEFAESNVLLRVSAELPQGVKVATERFSAGWGVMRSGGLKRLERKIQARGWSFVGVGCGAMQGGVGTTQAIAVATALGHALALVHPQSNAVELKWLELTQYPWFCLARVRLNSYRVQEGIAFAAMDEHGPVLLMGREKRMLQSSALDPRHAGSVGHVRPTGYVRSTRKLKELPAAPCSA